MVNVNRKSLKIGCCVAATVVLVAVRRGGHPHALMFDARKISPSRANVSELKFFEFLFALGAKVPVTSKSLICCP